MHYVADEIKSSPFPVMAAAMTETWWDERIEDAQVQIPGYALFRADREQRRGGGSALLVHGSLIVTDTVTWGNEFNNLVGVYVPSCHTILASIYRTGDFRETRQVLQEFIDKHSAGKPVPDLFLLGDLNLPQYNWDTGEGGHGDADEMSTLVDENFLGAGGFRTVVAHCWQRREWVVGYHPPTKKIRNVLTPSSVSVGDLEGPLGDGNQGSI